MTNFRKAVSAEYAAYCESSEAPQTSGPSPIRAAKLVEIRARLSLKYFPKIVEVNTNPEYLDWKGIIGPGKQLRDMLRNEVPNSPRIT
jgi:hypothetical protein